MLAFYKFLNLEVFFFVCVHACLCTVVHIWRSEGNFLESVLSFHHVTPRDLTQVWWQVPLPVQPSHKPETFSLKAQSLAGCGITGF